jgi:RHS repeat-associated protein
VGWEIPLDHVRRSLRNGVPRYLGPASDPANDDPLEFRLGDHSGTLVYVGVESGLYLYRPKIEGAFAKFYYKATDDTWIVQDRSGKTWYLGGYNGDAYAKDRDPADATRTFAWYVRYLFDPHGNSIRYDYWRESGNLYPIAIRYDNAGTTNNPCGPIVTFSYDSWVVPTSVSYRKGYRSELDSRYLEEITVTGYDELCVEKVRRYWIDQGKAAPGEEANLFSFQPQYLPAATFSYTSPPAISFATGQDLTMPGGLNQYDEAELLRSLEVTCSSSTSFESKTVSMLGDVDGDGKPDHLVYARFNGGVLGRYWRRNTGAGFEAQARSISVPDQPPITPPNGYEPDCFRMSFDQGGMIEVRQDVLDLDGDGKVDFVVASSDGHIWVAPGKGDGSFHHNNGWIQWTHSPIAANQRLAHTVSTDPFRLDDAALLDMNGDGLPDYVHADGANVHVHVNRGWPNGVLGGFDSTGQAINLIGYDGLGGMKYGVRAYNTDGHMIFDVRDVTGDGVPDHVRTRATPSDSTVPRVARGTGRFDGTLFFTDIDAFDLPEDSELGGLFQESLNNVTAYKNNGYVGLYDLDADGRLDLLYRRYYNDAWQEYRYRRNVGDGFAAPVTLAVDGAMHETPSLTVQPSFPPGTVPPGYCEVVASGIPGETIRVNRLLQTVIDFNGDGRVDLVRGTTDPLLDGNWRMASAAPDWRPPYLLREVISGQAKTELTYDRAVFSPTAQTCPLKQWTLRELKETDLVTLEERTKRLTCTDPVYDARLREFRGHTKSLVRESGSKSAHVRFQETTFRTGEFDFGREQVIDTRATEGWTENPARRVTNEWEEAVVPGGDRRWVRLAAQTTKVTDLLGSTETRVEHVYHLGELEKSLGLLAQTTHKGFSSSPVDKHRITDFTYHLRNNTSAPPSHTNPLMVRPWRETLKSGLGATVGQTTWLYDTMCPSGQGSLTVGSLCETRVSRDNGNPQPEGVTRTTYDARGRLTQKIDPDGVATNYGYSSELYPYPSFEENTYLHRTSYREYDGLSGKPGQVCGPQHVGSPATDKCDRTTYDLYGRPLQVWQALDSGTGGYQQWLVQTNAYVPGSSTVPARVEELRVPDPILLTSPSQLSKASFNRWGQTIHEEQALPANTCGARYFTYDGLGRLARANLPYLAQSCGYPAAPPENGERYSYEHDLLDRVTRAEHANGDAVKLTYVGAVTEVRDERDFLTTYTHNGFGEVEGIGKSLGSQTLASSFGYDHAGRVTSATDEGGKLYSYTYYGDGTLYYATTPGGAVTYERTPAGRLTQRENAQGDKVIWSYDAIGRPYQRRVEAWGSCKHENNIQLYTLTYDGQTRNLGRLTSVTGPDSLYTKTFDYDAAGHLTLKRIATSGYDVTWTSRNTPFGAPLAVTYPSGRVIDHSYDGSGNLARVRDASTLDLSLTYKPGHRVEWLGGYLQGTGGRLDFDRQYTYDAKHRLSALSSRKGTPLTAFWTATYGYTPNNTVASLTDSYRGFTRNFGYDSANRLTSAINPVGEILAYSYRPDSSLQSALITDIWSTQGWYESYSYRTTGAVQAITWRRGSAAFTHDQAGQCCTATRTGEAPPGGTPTYARSYTWYGDGALASISHQTIGRDPVNLLYNTDEDGKRWRSAKVGSRGEILSQTVYLDDRVEVRDGVVHEHLTLPNLRIELRPADGQARAHFGDLTDTAAVIDNLGNELQKKRYRPYGQEIVVLGTDSFPFGFQSKRREAALDAPGLPFPGAPVDFGARVYDPDSRQFISPDPLRWLGVNDVVDGLNTLQPYVFAAANPASFLERFGLDPVPNYFIRAEVGRYDVFRSANWGASLEPAWTPRGVVHALAKSAASLLNNVSNTGAWVANAAVNATENARDGLCALTRTTKAEWDALPMTGAVFGGLKVLRSHPKWLAPLAGKSAQESAQVIQKGQARAAKILTGKHGITRIDVPAGDVTRPGNYPHAHGVDAHGRSWSVNIDGTIHDARTSVGEPSKRAIEALREKWWDL